MNTYNNAGVVIGDLTTNCKLIAHRGYHVTASQNTIQSFIDAYKNGFRWVEIDIRVTDDNVYVLAHDSQVTLYNGSTPTSVTIASSNFSTIKNYTWDAAGRYRLSTLLGAFNAMQAYDMGLICDLKTGTNEEVIRLASAAGCVDKIMISYGTTALALNDLSLIKAHPHIPVRVNADNYQNLQSLKSQIDNRIYCGSNASVAERHQIYPPIALACNLPIIFAGCTMQNRAIWAGICNGCMANENDNISAKSFLDLITDDYSKTCTITTNTQNVVLNTGNTSTVTATSSLNSLAGYIHGYCLNPDICSAKQTVFGNSASITLTAKVAGETILRLFSPNGTMVDIPVTVTS